MPKPFAIVAGDFTPWGGMERPNYELAWHLAERMSLEVHLVSHRVASPLSRHPKVVWHRVPRPFGRHAMGAPLLDRLGRRVAEEVEHSGGTVVVNGGNCLWNDVNWVHYVHNSKGPDVAKYPPLQSLRLRWGRQVDRIRERKALSYARIVIADSNLAREQLLNALTLDPERVHTIYYGVDPNVFRPATSPERRDARQSFGMPADRPLVAFVGGLGYDRRKGFDVLFDAWRFCCEEPSWDAILAVAGTGPEMPLWRRRVAEEGRGGDIKLLGFTEAIPSLLRAADALVSPTRFEPYGQGVHEAVCCGLPVFVTRSAGITERFPAELSDMLLDDPPDAAQLSRLLRDWHRNIEGYRCRVAPMGDLFRMRTWEDMALEFVSAVGGGDP